MKKLYTLSISFLFAAGLMAQNVGGLNMSASNDVQASTAGGFTTGIEDVENSEKVQIYSFGSQVYVNLEGFGNVNGQIDVYDLLGKQVLRTNFMTNNLILPVNVTSASIYIVNVNINGKNYTEKLYIK